MPSQPKKPRPGIRHRLRLYERQYEMLLWPSFLLAIATYILWWISYDYPVPIPGRNLVLLVSAAAWLLYLLSLIGPSFSYVQCRADYIVIRSLLFRLAISYSRIGNVVPINFGTKYPFRRQGWSQRTFLEPLFTEQGTGQLTVVAMQLKQYPMPLIFLNRYIFFVPQDGPGFLFIVRNWMALSHEIDDYREAWRVRRAARKSKSTTSIASEIIMKGDRRR
jgi:hypothetical protein